MLLQILLFLRFGLLRLARRHGVQALLVVLTFAGSGVALAYEHPEANPLARSHAETYPLRGKVVRVIDGDTFTLLSDGREVRVRMASIDAPETSKGSKRPGQPMGRVSTKALANLIAGKTLALVCYEKDHYGRDVCDVPLPDGTTASERQVESGMAWANMEGRGKFMRDPKLPRLEEKARQARLGLWRDPDPVKPWAWRYDCWRKGRC